MTTQVVAERKDTFYVSTAANSSMQQFTFTGAIDNYRTRHVKAVYCGFQASGVAIALYAAGQQYCLIDTTRFANGNPPVDIEFDIPAKLSLVVGVQDLAGAAHANVPIVITYMVDPQSGP